MKMKVIGVFKVNNIDYSIIETNKNNTFVIPNNCFYLYNNGVILIYVDLFKTTDSHNYELYLKIKESEDKLKIIEIFKKDNNKKEILDLEKEFGREELVNLYIEEYLKHKHKNELHIGYINNCVVGIRKCYNIYKLYVKKETNEMVYDFNIDVSNPYKTLMDFRKNYTIYFDKVMLKYKVNVINHIKSVFKYNCCYPTPDKEYTKITNDEIINIFKNEDEDFNSIDLHMNLGTECFINKLVEFIAPESIIFDYDFGERQCKVMLWEGGYMNSKYYVLNVYNTFGNSIYNRRKTNAYELLKEVLNNYYYDKYYCCLKEKKEKTNNYMTNYLESIF
jgi:hypothetical protein